MLAHKLLSIEELKSTLDFGNITFEINDFDVEQQGEQFVPTDCLLRYRFVTPWVALNHMTGGRYKFLTNQEKPSFLNRLLGQNIIFLAKEVGIKIEDSIFTKVKLESLFPKPLDDNKWGAFMGEFKTNFLFPSYIFYMQGGIPEDTKSAWVDKEYWAVLEIDESSKNHGGESTIFKLKRTSSASPQPEWCVTEGGSEFAGKGPACLKTPEDPKSMNQLRFKVKTQYSETAKNLPAELQNKNWVQYEVGYDDDGVALNRLPGRLSPPDHTFGPVTLYIVID